MLKEITIQIGEYHASRSPLAIRTVLGSCVAVCLFDPVNRIGGMNHILLPGRADMKHFDAPARFGVNAMELLINRLMNLGGNRNKFVAKIFGGGHIVPMISREKAVGSKNVEFVKKFLRMENIKIVGQDIGGRETRRVTLHTQTGDVFLKRINSHFKEQVVVKECDYFKGLRTKCETPGGMEIF